MFLFIVHMKVFEGIDIIVIWNSLRHDIQYFRQVTFFVREVDFLALLLYHPNFVSAGWTASINTYFTPWNINNYNMTKSRFAFSNLNNICGVTHHVNILWRVFQSVVPQIDLVFTHHEEIFAHREIKLLGIFFGSRRVPFKRKDSILSVL